MNMQDIINRAIQIRQKYDRLNEENGIEWKSQDFMSGFIGDVGDLSKIIMAKQGLRSDPDVDRKLAHELADCLWSICILANEYGINLEAAFSQTMHELDKRLDSQMQT